MESLNGDVLRDLTNCSTSVLDDLRSIDSNFCEIDDDSTIDNTHG